MIAGLAGELGKYMESSRKKEYGKIPFFADKRYDGIEFNNRNFREIKAGITGKKIGFVDAGNMEVVCAPSCSIHLIRVCMRVFRDNIRERIGIPEVMEFFSVARSEVKDGKICYFTKLFPMKEEFRVILPDEGDLRFDSMDGSIMRGNHMAPISVVGGLARRFAEWRAAGLLAGYCDIIVRDGTLQTSVTNEGKYSKEAYGKAMEKGVTFTALAKTSSLYTDNGSSLLGAVKDMEEKIKEWYYHPVCENKNPDHEGEIYVVRLHGKSRYVFRFEVHREQNGGVEEVMKAIAYNSTDIAFVGYPYGLLSVDLGSRVSGRRTDSLKVLLGSKERGEFAMDAHDLLNKYSGG